MALLFRINSKPFPVGYLSLAFLLRNGVFLALSVNKDATVINNRCPPCEPRSPKVAKEGKEQLPSCSHQTASTPYGEPQGRSGCENTGPRWVRNDISESRLVHLPICRKALNPLTWEIWFSLINDNILTLRLPALCCKTSI